VPGANRIDRALELWTYSATPQEIIMLNFIRHLWAELFGLEHWHPDSYGERVRRRALGDL
jgi:hypothetical protein